MYKKKKKKLGDFLFLERRKKKKKQAREEINEDTALCKGDAQKNILPLLKFMSSSLCLCVFYVV